MVPFALDSDIPAHWHTPWRLLPGLELAATGVDRLPLCIAVDTPAHRVFDPDNGLDAGNDLPE
jgi:hypothetical protein